MSDENYSLALPFDSDDTEFVRGFEAGRLYEQVKTGEDFDQTIHTSNAEMAIRICEAEDREFSATQLDDNWTELHVGARQTGD